MRRSPAEFARVKVRFPTWYIQRTLPGAAVPGYTAVEIATGRRIRCASLAELESRLQNPRIVLSSGKHKEPRPRCPHPGQGFLPPGQRLLPTGDTPGESPPAAIVVRARAPW